MCAAGHTLQTQSNDAEFVDFATCALLDEPVSFMITV